MSLATAPEYQPTAVPDRGDRAVVLGGGMAGLLAARVLADAYQHVTLVEKDPFPDGPAPREGVPQSTHVHVLLEAGRVVLERLFPGFTDRVEQAGGVTIDSGTDLDYHQYGDVVADATTSLPMLCASRPLLEATARTGLEDIDGVDLRDGCLFREYRQDESGHISGIVVTDRNDTTERLEVDLVVDATGRASRTPEWLAANGYRRPAFDEVTIDLAYSSVMIDRPSDRQDGYLVAPDTESLRGGTAIPIEDDRWIVTLFGLHGTHPPTDPAGFKAFADDIPVPALRRLLETNDWLSTEIAHYPFPSNRWTHYERLEDWPGGVLPIGDAIASFNPIYGQGMSVAALETLELHAALADADPSGLASGYFSGVEDVLSTVWLMTVAADFEFPQTTGPRPRGSTLFNWYQQRLIRAAHDDGRLTTAFAKVLRFEQEPTALAHPATVARVLWPR